MRYVIFDIETDGLLEDVSKIHCLSYYYNIDNNTEIKTLFIYQEMIDFFNSLEPETYIVGHNIIRYDLEVLKNIVGLDIKGKRFPIIDTLALSWYLQPKRKKHGLEAYGEEYELPKVEIKDWQNLTQDDYQKRCERDVEINTILFRQQFPYLFKLYDGYSNHYNPLIKFLNFKMECLRDQERDKIFLDKPLCDKCILELTEIISKKISLLSEVMPKDLGKVLKTKPKKMFKADKTPSSLAIKWKQYLEDNNLPLYTEEVREKPNPCSFNQMKEWLISLGWQPETFKVSKQTGEKVPQISLPFGQGLCKSVKKLYEVEPILEELDGLYIAQHRLSVFQGFLECLNKNGYIISSAHALTKTLRFKHSKPIVNLPGVGSYYGKEIRSCITVPNNAYTMFGVDISALEDSTKQHYIYFFDPDYVTQMRVPGFDPHLDISVLSGLMTQEQADRFKELDSKENKTDDEKKELKILKDLRHNGKTVNFAATYNAGPAKIADTLKKPIEIGKKLHETYWSRNWAIKETVKKIKQKTINNQLWIYNPVSRFWLFLEHEKDIFSSINQHTGVFVFNTFLKNMKNLFGNEVLWYQEMHDETGFITLKYKEKLIEKKIAEAMDLTNKELKLNVEIKYSIEKGQNYAECH